MVAAALKPDVLLLPRAPGGNGSGAAMAVLVHALLLAGLTLGVDWRTHSPDVVSAELWAAVPQSAAPPPPPPPAAEAPAPRPAPPVEKAEKVEKTPAPPAPDIALEKERKRAEEKKKADEKKAEDERKERDKREKAERAEKADEDRRERQREENLRRMLAQAGANPSPTPATPGTGTAATNAAPSAAYAGRVKAAVRPNIVFTERLATNNAAEVEVTAAPGGSIISRKLVKSSGSAEWDDAVLRAIDKTRTLPRDTDGRVPAALLLVFRPNE